MSNNPSGAPDANNNTGAGGQGGAAHRKRNYRHFGPAGPATGPQNTAGPQPGGNRPSRPNPENRSAHADNRDHRDNKDLTNRDAADGREKLQTDRQQPDHHQPGPRQQQSIRGNGTQPGRDVQTGNRDKGGRFDNHQPGQNQPRGQSVSSAGQPANNAAAKVFSGQPGVNGPVQRNQQQRKSAPLPREHDIRENREVKDIHEHREPRDNREFREIKAAVADVRERESVEPREVRTAVPDNRDNREARESRERMSRQQPAGQPAVFAAGQDRLSRWDKRIKTEESYEDIKKDNERLEKEIWLEIAGLHTIKLDY